MRICFLIVLACAVAQAQKTTPAKSQNNDPTSSSSSSQSSSQNLPHNPNLAPPRSDGVDVHSMPIDPGESSSKADPVDLSPPADDAKTHPKSSDILMDEGSGSAEEVLPWDPHKAAKDVEVGDYYFKRKNYRAAEDRYREALRYKDNDAIATYRLAVCLEKMDRPDEAREEYESYLNILPNGPEALEAKRAIERLKSPTANAKGAK
jgi:tetratricopeptide (TPR) repeat protein